MDHAPVLIPDSTLLIQMALFFVAFGLMNGLVFKPYLKLLALRRSRTSDLVKAAEKAKLRAQELQATVDGALRDERTKINSWMDDEKKKISEEERQLLVCARNTAASELETARATINEDVNQARQKLAPLVQEYASQIATRLLGRKVIAAASTSRGVSSEAEQRIPT